MKKTKIIYWISTILFAGFMLFSSIPGIKPSAQSIQVLHDYLQYPIYFIRLISVAKLLGVIVLFIPGLHSIKEWAYAGLFFDLMGAIFSFASVAKKLDGGTAFIFLVILLGVVSYWSWKKMMRRA